MEHGSINMPVLSWSVSIKRIQLNRNTLRSLICSICPCMHENDTLVPLADSNFVITVSVTYPLADNVNALEIKTISIVLDESSYSNSRSIFVSISTGYPNGPPMMAASSIVTLYLLALDLTNVPVMENLSPSKMSTRNFNCPFFLTI
uniref:Uncharacterized protein MANES_03G089800 n=1 Tax=Rhizophora mucronata TaxID=61149 RepID=A0A2P2LYZ3_RHIMU